MRRLLLAALLLAFPAAAGAQTAHVDLGFTPDGDPSLLGSPRPNGGLGSVTQWSICRPATACTTAPGGPVLEPGDEPAGTTFTVTVAYNGTTTTDTTPAWGGRLTATQLPAVTGDPVVGETMGTTPAVWAGGWPGDNDFIEIQVCRTPAMTGCVVILDPFYGPGLHPTGPQGRLEPADAGGYVFAVDRRRGASWQMSTQGYDTTRDIPPLVPGQTIAASAPLGPVQPSPYASVSPTPAPPPTPAARVLAVAVGTSVGTVARRKS